MFRPLTAVLAALVLALAACGDDDEAGSSDGGSGSAAESQSPAEESAGQGCREVEQPKAKPDGGAQRPSERLAPGRTYRVRLATSCGTITIELDQKASPRTAASFAELARSGFFDGTTFHRIVPGFVIQGGDPTGSGTGGPGYSTRDVPPAGTVYSKGVVAMAKAATEAPGTAGSQFYIVTAPDAGLPPDYALLGRVIEGQRVVDAIGELGDPASGDAGIPLRPVVLESAEVLES